LDKQKIIKKCNRVRSIFLNLILSGSKYHLGGSLSCIDILCTLVYNNFINFEQNRFKNFILSKGHALGIFHSILIEKKILTSKELIKQKKNFVIGNQLDIFYPKKKMFAWNSGSLGHSLGLCIGIALVGKKKVWTIIGDAEFDEGSIWEALFYISDKKIKNIIIIVDNNKVSASSVIEYKKILDLNFLKKLDINIEKINGHDLNKLSYCFKKVSNLNKSSLIICETIKGKGIKEIENNLKFSHHMPSNEIIKKYVEN
tara:strand:- start:196 stop:966 length:771 start_codon:yes stop_codon:yes gene_type:complete